jgi:hypothetical protein
VPDTVEAEMRRRLSGASVAITTPPPATAVAVETMHSGASIVTGTVPGSDATGKLAMAPGAKTALA